jgi:ATP-binding cassette, subfamily B (MDR/TAP), member 1
VANDAVSSIRTVASFCAEKRVLEAYEKKCDEPVKQGVRQGLVSGIGYGFAYMLLYCSYALCFYVGSLFIRNGNATFSQVFRVSTKLCIFLFLIKTECCDLVVHLLGQCPNTLFL